MLLFYLAAMVIGLGIVGWLFFGSSNTNPKDTKNTDSKDGKDNQPSLLERLGLNDDKPKKENAKSLKNADLPEIKPPMQTLPETPTNTSLDLQENSLPPTIDTELPAQYERLEVLFKEKSEQLEKSEKALANELKTHKEFNKIKDLLEKELKDTKDKNHKTQLELTAFQAEVENYKNRLSQSEGKIKLKEQDIKQKEQQIDELVKKLQTFAAPALPQSASQAPNIPGASSDTKKPVETQESQESAPSNETKLPDPLPQASTVDFQPKEKTPANEEQQTPINPDNTTKSSPKTPQTEEKQEPEKEKTFVQGEPIRQPPRPRE